MTAPSVLVPMQVDALVVNRSPRLFIRDPRAYGALSLVQSPEQLAFPTPQEAMQGGFGQTSADRGVHLMWTLPAALRQGRQADGGAIRFPIVPNRWIVVRWRGAPGEAAPVAWGLESDYLGTDGASPFVAGEGGAASPTRIGRATPLAPGTPWAPAASAPFLTAVGPGDPGFALFQSGMADVFSFHDAFDEDQPGVFSYAVAGWYSDPGADVLADAALGAGLADRLAALDWAAPADVGPVSLYHGAALGVVWDPTADLEPAGRRDATVSVAIANTGVDGLKALVEAAPGQSVDADLLEAFQYGLLDALNAPGADAVIDAARRKAAFVAEPAGVRWEAVNAGTDETEIPAGAATPDQIAAEIAFLARLNADQAALEASRRTLKSLRRRLFEAWWKSAFAARNAVTVDQGALAALVTTLSGQVRDAMAAAAAIALRLPNGPTTAALKASTAAFGADLGPGRELKSVPQPPRYTAAPPVLMIAGANHGEDALPQQALVCRAGGQTVSAVEAPVAGPGGLTAAALSALAPAFTAAGAPPETGAVLSEAFLLDPANAALFAARVLGRADPETAEALAQALGAPVPIAGILASVWPAAPWSQPWRPLYVDWQVDWYDLPFEQWAFDGTDYAWQGPGTAPTSPRALPYAGRSFLAPQPGFVFARRLQKFVADHPALADEAALLQAVQTAGGWDVLTQSLTGLPDWIGLRDPRIHLAPDDTTDLFPGSGLTLARLIGEGPPHPPQSINPKPPHHGDAEPPFFSGLRAGQFAIRHLRILDRFGQSLDLLGPDVIHPASLAIAPDLRTDKPVTTLDGAGFAAFAPRALQAARLNLDFVPDPAPGAPPAGPVNPVAGWLLPNHMDAALAAYSADGAYLGELGPSTDGSALVWLAGGDPRGDSLASVAALSAELGGALQALQSQGPEVWSVFSSVVDETLWTVEPLGARRDQVISALAGRPLAVVRAALSLDLAEDALREPSWPSTLSMAPGPLSSVSVPVRLGDLGRRADGLIGYFEADFTRFHSVHDPAVSGGQTAPFITPIGQDGYLHLTFDAPPTSLILLMDPRAAVSATTGLLPLTDARIPDRFVTPALARMAVSLRAGAVLTRPAELAGAAGQPSVQALRMPVPASQAGVWTWRGPGGDLPVAPSDQTALFAGSPTLRDGLLVLSGGVQEDG